MFPPLRTARAGFTLIELAIGIAIMAILLTIAAPSLRDLIANVRLTGQANDLLTSFMFARSEATKRDTRITVCARQQSTDSKGNVTNVCNNGQQWDNGWLVVVDADGNGDMDNGTIALKSADALTGSNTVRNTGGSGTKGYVTFTSTGINATGPATFMLCDPRGQGRAVAIAPTGRAAISKIDKDCK